MIQHRILKIIFLISEYLKKIIYINEINLVYIGNLFLSFMVRYYNEMQYTNCIIIALDEHKNYNEYFHMQIYQHESYFIQVTDILFYV